MTKRSRQRHLSRSGVTLIEMMITLAIMAMLIGIAAPSLSESLEQQEVYDAAREVTIVFKSQRHRARNLNLATGVLVSATNNVVQTYISTDTTCANLQTGSPTVAIDVGSEFELAKIVDNSNTTAYVDRVVCIKPNGRVLDHATLTPFTSANSDDIGGAATFEIGRFDDTGKNHVIHLPYSGVARMSQ